MLISNDNLSQPSLVYWLKAYVETKLDIDLPSADNDYEGRNMEKYWGEWRDSDNEDPYKKDGTCFVVLGLCHTEDEIRFTAKSKTYVKEIL